MAADWDELLAEVRQWLGRNDLEALLPGFVKDAEARLNRELRLKVMEREAVLPITAGNAVVRLPDRRVPGDWDVFLEMRDLRLNGDLLKNLDFMALDTLPERRASGRPYAYSIRGLDLVLTPTPDADYEALLSYWAEIPPLGPEQATNEVLLRNPDVYRLACLLAAVPYTRSSSPGQAWLEAYAIAVTALRSSDNSGRFTANLGGRPLRSI